MAEGVARQGSIVWPLRGIAVASLIGPLALFAYAGLAHYRALDRQADERIERALDITQEHALKAFQTIERVIAEANEVLRDLSDEEIRADEARLSQRLKRTVDALPQTESIWAFDRSGRPLVSATVLPVPRGLDNSDRDYFRAQAAGREPGVYIGDVVNARVGSLRFFVVSGRRPDRDGAFDGVIGVTALPGHFTGFYERLSRGVANSFGIVRADGAFLARHPSRPGTPERLNGGSVFVQAIRTRPEAGRFEAVSQIDGIARRIGYRLVPGYPVYVQAGIETGAIWREWRASMAGHAAFGLPATLALFGLSLHALGRARRFQEEVGRREAAEAALKQAQRLEALGRLTGGVAHDFNNLLMVVKGNADRLRRTLSDERQLRSLDAIEAAAGRGASLTRHLLSFSRQQTHEAQAIDLARRLPELQDMLRSSLRGDIAVSIAVEPGLWLVTADPSELELALLNIAVNARDAMPEGGRIAIRARNVTLSGEGDPGLRGEFVALSLADTGCGVPREAMGRVFEPFFTTKEVGKGTGLGLSQVYGFARQSGGGAAIASEPGQGATVTLYLPRCREPLAGAGAAQGSGAAAPGRGTILLVEDNPEIAEVTRANLADLGYTVLHAPDGAAALANLDANPGIEVVFSDIVMPGAPNGLDLARTVRERRPGLPVILATGYSDVAGAAAQEGFPILSKPYDVATLQAAIRDALGRRGLREVA